MIVIDKDRTDKTNKANMVNKVKGKYFSDHLRFLYGIKLKSKEANKLNKGRANVNPSILLKFEL